MKKFLLKMCVIGAFLLTSGVVSAQTSISGTVSDSDGPLPGVNVIIMGTEKGTSTDFDGRYQLDDVDSDAVLQFSSLGYVTQEIPIGSETSIDVLLEGDSNQLEEVVIIGYGSVRKNDATGAVEVIGAKDFTTVNAASPAQIMQGKVAGVQVTEASGEPGGAISVRIRGNSSIRSGNDPLYVIDGIPLASGNTSAGGFDGGLGAASAKNPLNFINQNDIASINILKDASSTAIYGSRGANGVVIITTKKGKGGAPRVEYAGNIGVQTIGHDIGMMSSSQYAEQAAINNVPNLDHGARGYDWKDAILQDAVVQSHDLSATFSGDRSNTRMSFGARLTPGIVVGTGMDKYTFSLNNSITDIFSRVKLESSVLVSQINDQAQSTSDNSGFIGNAIGSALYWNPTYPIRDSDGSYFEVSDTYLNPAQLNDAYDDDTATTRIIASIAPSIEIIDNLSYKFVFGIDYSTSSRSGQLLPSFQLQGTNGETSGGEPAGGFAFVDNIIRSNMTIENVFTYNVEISENFSLNALAGYSYYRYEYEQNQSSAGYFNENQINLRNNLEGGKNSEFRANSSKNVTELQSFFARVETEIIQNLLVNVSARYDGSSKVGTNNTYAWFPAVGAAYKIFDNREGGVNNLKVRLNWGIVGNQEFDPNSALAVGQYNDGNLVQTGNSNADLKWETTTSYGVGVDFRFIETLSGSMDYYYKSTKDLVFPQPGASNVPNNAGTTTFVNLPGTLESQGFELGLNWDAVRKDTWTLSFSGNFAYLKNEMKDFPLFILTGGINGQGLTGASASIIANELPLYTYYLNVWRGFDDNGNSIYAAPDGSDTGLGGAAKQQLAKTALPNINVGFNANATIGRFDINASFYGQYGGYLYNNTANALFFKGAFFGDKNVPLEYATANQSQGDPNSPSTRYLESSDFFRMQNLQVGYNFDSEKLGKHINKLRLSLTGNNLFVITDYSGFDPEVDTNKQINGVNSAGMDYFSYPRSKGFTFGVVVGF